MLGKNVSIILTNVKSVNMQFRSHLTIFLITEHGILVLIFSECDLVELDLCVSYNGVKTHLRVQ